MRSRSSSLHLLVCPPNLKLVIAFYLMWSPCLDSDDAQPVGNYAVSCPNGFGDLVEPKYFEVFGEWQTRYGRDSLRMSSHFLSLFNEQIAPFLSDAIVNCPAFVLETMMNAVLSVETNKGADEARAWLLQIYTLRDKAFDLATDPNLKQLRALMDEWAVDIAAIYPKFLDIKRLGPVPELLDSLSGTSNTNTASQNAGASTVLTEDSSGHVPEPGAPSTAEVEFCLNQRFYLYKLEPSFYGPGIFYCLQGQWGTEVILHHYFKHTCNTQDPELADWFYVPLYATCKYVKLNENISDDSSMMENMDDRSNKYIWEPLFEVLKHSKYYQRNQGRDHIFLFADGQGPRIWDSYDSLRTESVFLSPESKCPTWGEPMRRFMDIKPCMSSWKDIIIPGHTDYARIEYMRKQNRPSEDRNLLLTFHGRAPGLHDAYGDCAVRGRIMRMASRGPHVDVGGFVSDYLERKGNSHFCLVPAGTSPWTNHLYESFYAGCVPVILSDEYVVAFAEELDWPSFSIKWPEVETGDSLHDYLMDLVQYFPGKVFDMKQNLERHACWFNWYSTNAGCNPYLLIHRRLKRLQMARKPRPRFWNYDTEKFGESAGEPPLVFAHLRRPTRFKSIDEDATRFKYLIEDSQEST